MPKIQLPRKLNKILSTKARFVVLIGGRSSAKSESVGRLLVMRAQTEAADILCGREYQTSIDDSVHKLLKNLILTKIPVSGFDITDKKIECTTGGGFRFKGFARNSDAVKSAQDFKYSWVEEAQFLSKESIKDLLPTIRSGGSQLFFTANPQSSADPFSKRFIVPYKDHLDKYGFYEDELHCIVVVNWRDNPWHKELEAQRVWDFENLPRAEYDHIWEGAFNDTIENSIIKPEWFDAAIDAHIKLGFKPTGIKVVAHDPADSGDDKALACRHGSVLLDAQSIEGGNVNDACDWATDYAVDHMADVFSWDADGLGLTLGRQVGESLKGKRVDYQMYKGSEGVDNPNEVYQDPGQSKTNKKRQKTNKESFRNKRAQKCWSLRDRYFNTYLAVIKGVYIDPNLLISVSSDIKELTKLRSETCRIPRKMGGNNGKIQILSKEEMKKLKIQSPNLFDSVVMAFDDAHEVIDTKRPDISFQGWQQ